mmetsp:Transcript_81916/g.163099  ORF Transcript_81916/g.163099 Transcript_81916/m.163099 type:complete len:253 (+) Transcript_81916:1830-2588(+)
MQRNCSHRASAARLSTRCSTRGETSAPPVAIRLYAPMSTSSYCRSSSSPRRATSRRSRRSHCCARSLHLARPPAHVAPTTRGATMALTCKPSRSRVTPRRPRATTTWTSTSPSPRRCLTSSLRVASAPPSLPERCCCRWTRQTSSSYSGRRLHAHGNFTVTCCPMCLWSSATPATIFSTRRIGNSAPWPRGSAPSAAPPPTALTPAPPPPSPAVVACLTRPTPCPRRSRSAEGPRRNPEAQVAAEVFGERRT